MTKRSKYSSGVLLVALVPILMATSLPANAAGPGIDLGKPMKIGKFDLSTKGIIKGVAKNVIVGVFKKLRRR